ncbi:MAG: methyl-accepting chemotaxis protein [Selenomonadaceae bacterium]|nr:methyl-accepting chemotaxis protein [Selenomonadaceae bacterium]
MNLQKKTILFLDAVLLLVCLILGLIGYHFANQGFEIALEDKAEADMRQTREILDLAYPGPWDIRKDGLYKGDQRMNDAFDIVDHLGKLTGNNITIFSNDTRVATTFVKDGNRAVGTQASEAVAEIVLKNGQNYTGEADVLGNTYFCAYEPIKDEKGRNIGMLFMGIPKAEVDALQDSFIYSTVFATILLILIMGALVFFAVRFTLRPLEKVHVAMDQISKGDLKEPPLMLSGQDEIAQISHSADCMKESLVKILKRISDSAQQVADSSELLNTNASQTAISIHQVADSIVKIAGDTESQSASLNDIQDAASAMSQDMTELYAGAESMRQAAEQSRQGAQEGHHAVADAMDAMGKMTAQMNASSQVVETLGGRSKEIGKIVETISALAEQTNLLALNAAIEAARAGEAGRGFAVVADEVRKLAEQSGEAAQNISSIIGGIQNDTLQAMQAMARGGEEVRAGTEIVQKTGEVFSLMGKNIDTLYDQIQLLRSHVEAAEKGSSRMLEKVEMANEFSRTTADEAQTVSAATEEQTAVVHDISDASETLSKLAQELQNEVFKFQFS